MLSKLDFSIRLKIVVTHLEKSEFVFINSQNVSVAT